MSKVEPLPLEPPSSSLCDRVDLVCDQFETALRQGKQPRIEEFLAAFPAAGRAALLRELVALEIDSQAKKGWTITFADYYRRFPDAAPVLDSLQAELNSRDSGISVEVQAPVTVDINAQTIAWPNAPRRRIKHFELLSLLGEGGFGTVWRAKDMRLQREVALKIPRKDRIAATDMAFFLREARAAAKLHHPNIVAIHEVGEHESSAFIVSDLVDGLCLRDWVETHRMSFVEMAILVSKLATAVHHAHERGIVHRDLKPANVLIDQSGEPHIADFGLAKRDAAEDSLAINNQVIGTPAYMSPEQAIADHKAVDRRSDVYSLGAIFYELLTGQRVFRGELSMLLLQIQNSPPVPPRKIQPSVPRELEAICLKCLAKEREKRYATAQDLADDLHRFVGGETLRGIPTALPNRVQKWFRRNRRPVLAALTLAVVAGVVSGYLAWFIHPPAMPAEFRTVHFTTKPPGCELTVVTIDPDTGEPDPTKIQNAKGLAPQTMMLPPGDYLVVAVLPGESRFHEVYRQVPTPWATQKGVRPAKSQNNNWNVRESGEIDSREIVIPGLDVTVGMGFVEGTDRLEEPDPSHPDRPKQWQVPAFFVDAGELLYPPTKGKDGQLLPPQKLRRTFDEESVRRLEQEGKRFPSAAELFYLLSQLCPAPLPTDDDAGEAPACELPDRSKTLIREIHSGLWEWTTTRPGGPCTGLVYDSTMGDFTNLRMVGCGDRSKVFDTTVSATGFRWQPEGLYIANNGVRGVRSAKPRRTPEDFVSPVVRK